jgi:hypothetical protein
MALDILIQTIPHSEQRYNSIGDYISSEPGMESKVELTPGKVIISVSDLGDWRKELCVAIHELFEVATACWQQGIKDETIVKFDKAYEELADKGLVPEDSEPGDSPDAPYHAYHKMATMIEYATLVSLGVTEAEYEEAMLELWRPDGNESKE